MTEPQTPGRGSPPAILRLALDRPPTLGKGRLVCVDGPAGSGKTTLAAALAELGGGGVVHMDDLYEGWSGLATIDQQLHELLTPLSEGRAGRYRRYDWDEKRFAEEVVVEPAAMTILEGVASGAARFADLITVLAWVEVPYDLRLARGVERGGVGVEDNWRDWAAGEQEHFERERTRERADVSFDGRVGSLGG